MSPQVQESEAPSKTSSLAGTDAPAMKAADFIAAELAMRGVRHVFEVVGGMITHLVDAIAKRDEIKIVSMHHEQGASFAADAVGRLTGVPGVAMATSGPGATNLLTGIGSCYFDSSPAVFITGQVNRHEQKGSRPVRQLGFQETDVASMASPITKRAFRVESPEELPRIMDAAFEIATSDRPGPVLIDVPMDVQRLAVTKRSGSIAPKRLVDDSAPELYTKTVELLDAIAKAQRPLILAGGGIRAANAAEAFRQFVDVVRVPVVYSLMAVDVLPSDHPLRVGLIGSYGNRWANLAFANADLLIVLGSRLDIRQTGADTVAFKGDRQIFHVDCDRGEVNNRVLGCRAIHSHLRTFISEAYRQSRQRQWITPSSWQEEIASQRRSWPDTRELDGIVGINPNVLVHELTRGSPNAAAFIVDVGQHQMWAAQSAELTADQRFLTSGGMGAMGFALPAAIGATYALGGRPVVVIAGDGGFQLNIQELQTVVRNGLPLKMVIVNNQCHGMVRQFQESYFNARYQSTLWGYSAPDFAEVARAYGIEAATVRAPEDTSDAIAAMWREPQQPYLLQVMIDTYANAYPKLAFGRPITEMEPLAKPIEMEST